MPALSLAYLVAAALIGFMLFLARRNQKQGWHRERNAWGRAKSSAVFASIEPRFDPPSELFSDLARLHHALASEDKVARKKQLTPSR